VRSFCRAVGRSREFDEEGMKNAEEGKNADNRGLGGYLRVGNTDLGTAE